MADLATARIAKERLRDRLAHEDAICGIGLARGADGYELRVVLSRAEACGVVPAVVDGIPVRVRVTGPLHARRDGPATGPPVPGARRPGRRG